MSGRQGELDVTHEVSRLTRLAMMDENAEALLIAEHCHDATGDLVNGAWHGTMNYAGFLRPVWSWLNDGSFVGNFMGMPINLPQFGEDQFISTVRAFMGQMSWQATVGSWNLLGSHDTPRVRTVVGRGQSQRAAVGLLMTMPGMPMIFAGDEIGEQGEWGEDARTPFPWDVPDRWDREMLDWYKRLIDLRLANPALQVGGLRWLKSGTNCLAFVRETEQDRLLVVVSRREDADVHISSADMGFTSVETLLDGDVARTDDGFIVRPGDPMVGVWRIR
jgi:alpha-glucosidase